MFRTQIYITDEQRRLIAQRARDAEITKAEMVRRLIDDGLGIDDGTEARGKAILSSAGSAANESDWEEWLIRVRGGSGADSRIRDLAP